MTRFFKMFDADLGGGAQAPAPAPVPVMPEIPEVVYLVQDRQDAASPLIGRGGVLCTTIEAVLAAGFTARADAVALCWSMNEAEGGGNRFTVVRRRLRVS